MSSPKVPDNGITPKCWLLSHAQGLLSLCCCCCRELSHWGRKAFKCHLLLLFCLVLNVFVTLTIKWQHFQQALFELSRVQYICGGSCCSSVFRCLWSSAEVFLRLSLMPRSTFLLSTLTLTITSVCCWISLSLSVSKTAVLLSFFLSSSCTWVSDSPFSCSAHCWSPWTALLFLAEFWCVLCVVVFTSTPCVFLWWYQILS